MEGSCFLEILGGRVKKMRGSTEFHYEIILTIRAKAEQHKQQDTTPLHYKRLHSLCVFLPFLPTASVPTTFLLLWLNTRTKKDLCKEFILNYSLEFILWGGTAEAGSLTPASKVDLLPPQAVPPPGGKVCACLSLWGTFLLLTASHLILMWPVWTVSYLAWKHRVTTYVFEAVCCPHHGLFEMKFR